jgi:hypothetical protein
MIVLMETSKPISPPQPGPAHSLQGAAEDQTPHGALPAQFTGFLHL